MYQLGGVSLEWWAAYYSGLAAGLNKKEALYQALRGRITAGFFSRGERLPSTRETARALGLSRGTVIQAYESLIAEGFLEAVQGGCTMVSGEYKQASEARSAQPKLSNWGQRVQEISHHRISRTEDKWSAYTIDLRPQDRSIRIYPEQEWQQCLRAALRISNPHTEEAVPKLEEAIATHLTRWRGVHTTKDRIVITNGSQQALMMITSMLLNAGDHVLLETPSYHGIREAVTAAGGVPAFFACDDEDELQLMLHQSTARLAIVTPNRQFPTGRSLGTASRSALIEWAERNDAFIIEDDFDSDFGFGNRRYEPLHAMDTNGRVLYIGSFTRTMSSELRIGYMVLPEKWIVPIHALMKLNGIYNLIRMEHIALALFMHSGNYERHLRRVNREHRRKVQIFCDILQEYAGHLFKWYASDIGFHLYAIWKQDPALYEKWSAEARRQGMMWKDGSDYAMTDCHQRSAIFGIAHVDEAAWRQACQRMSLAWNHVIDKIETI